MTEDGILSIVRRGQTYQVRYASYNPYALDRSPYSCADEDTLVAWLHQCGLDAWSSHRAVATLRKGGGAVLPVVLSEAQFQAYFPLNVPRVSAGTRVPTAGRPPGPAATRAPAADA